jgi:hypothetical protein
MSLLFAGSIPVLFPEVVSAPSPDCLYISFALIDTFCCAFQEVPRPFGQSE